MLSDLSQYMPGRPTPAMIKQNSNQRLRMKGSNIKAAMNDSSIQYLK